LSVTPTVRLTQAPQGPNAGKVLQPFLPGLISTRSASSSEIHQ
jgi:hypothetical protein